MFGWFGLFGIPDLFVLVWLLLRLRYNLKRRLILNLLARRPGRALDVFDLVICSDGGLSIGEAIRVLSRMLDEGLIQQFWKSDNNAGGPSVSYFSRTQAGKEF